MPGKKKDIQPAPSMTFLVYNNPSKMGYNDHSRMVSNDPHQYRKREAQWFIMIPLKWFIMILDQQYKVGYNDPSSITAFWVYNDPLF